MKDICVDACNIIVRKLRSLEKVRQKSKQTDEKRK